MSARSMYALLVATLATTACGSFDRTTISMEPITGNTETSPAEPPSPSPASDAAAPTPPSPPSPPSVERRIVCGAEKVCTGAQLCCIRNASGSDVACVDGPSECAGDEATLVACRVAADCPAGNLCCAAKSATGNKGMTYCATSCPAPAVKLCDDEAKTSECPTGMRCTGERIDEEFGLTRNIYDACRPKADAATN